MRDLSPHFLSPCQPCRSSISQNLSTLQFGTSLQAPGPSSPSVFPADTGEGAGGPYSGPTCPIFWPQKLTFPTLSLPPSCCYSRREPRGRKISNSILIFWYVILHTEIALPKLRVPLGKSPVNFNERHHPERPGFCFTGVWG